MAKRHTQITAIIDTREQAPLDLERHGLAIVREPLPFGDYSLAVPDMRRSLAIERKSLSDFVTCCGRDRDRFTREVLALRGYRLKAIVCEFDLVNVLAHEYRSKIAPAAVVASISRWMLDGIPFVFAGSPVGAGWIVAKLLSLAAKDVLAFARVASGFEPHG